MMSLIIHGGCEGKPPEYQEQALRRQGTAAAGERAAELLRQGASAIDAVECALQIMEDNPIFDAGRGSYVNMLGQAEMDAMLMDDSGHAGGVACMQNIRHPITAARKVMECTPHHLLVGMGAELFARSQGLALTDSPEAHGPAVDPETMDRLLKAYKEQAAANTHYSTVGAAARDAEGRLCAGTSTGGIPRKLPGRMGDAAIIGAGTYAAAAGAACATGVGEGIMRLGVTRRIVDGLGTGMEVEPAVHRIIEHCRTRGIVCGVIAMDAGGRTGSGHNGQFMPVWSWQDRAY